MIDLENKKILFLGDSITEGVGASDKEHCYVSIFKNKTLSNSINYGISGTRIAIQKNPTPHPNEKFDLYFESRVALMDNDADYVFVFGGTNDFGHGDAKLGDINDSDLYTFYGAFDSLLTKLKNKYPKSKIIVITPLKRADEFKCPNKISWKKDYSLLDYVEAEKIISKKHNVDVLDAYNVSGMDAHDIDKCKKYFTPDGLHPSNDGHKRIADMIIEYIEENWLL